MQGVNAAAIKPALLHMVIATLGRNACCMRTALHPGVAPALQCKQQTFIPARQRRWCSPTAVSAASDAELLTERAGAAPGHDTV